MTKRPVAIAALALCLLAFAAWGQGFRFRRNDDFERIVSTATALFRLLGSDGAGVGTINDDLCTAFASELTGNYFCLRGDGTQSSSAAGTLTPTGSPTTGTETVCPSGPSCATVSTYRFNGTSQYLATPTVASPTSFSTCSLARLDDNGSNRRIIHRLGAFTLGVNGSSIQFQVGNTAGTFSTFEYTRATLAEWVLICGTYEYVGTTAVNVGRLYVNGTEVMNASNWVGPMHTTARPWSVMRDASGSTYTPGNLRAALYTEKVLSPTTIQSMANAVLPQLKGSQNESITFARNSTAVCEAPDGSLTNLAAHRPCWNDKGLAIRSAVTNRAIRSNEANTGWTNTALTITADADVAPDGTRTADRITETAVTSTFRISQTAAGMTTGQPAVLSAYVKPDGAVRYQLKIHNWYSCDFVVTGGVPAPSGCTSTAGQTYGVIPSARGFYRIWIHVPGAVVVATGPVIELSLGDATTAASHAGDPARASYVWGVQLESGASTPSRPVLTQGTAATSNAEDVSIPNPVPTGSDFCVASTIEPEGAAWPSGNVGIAKLGTASPNFSEFWYSASEGYPKIRTYGSDGLEKRLSATVAVVTNASQRLMACNTASGSQSLYRAGALLGSASTSGTGTGAMSTQPNTLYVGQGVSTYLGGYVKNFCVSAAPETCL